MHQDAVGSCESRTASLDGMSTIMELGLTRRCMSGVGLGPNPRMALPVDPFGLLTLHGRNSMRVQYEKGPGEDNCTVHNIRG